MMDNAYSSCSMPQLAMSTTTTTTTTRTVSKCDIQEQDVLCGRDKISHSHVGNKRFLCLIKQHRSGYQNATSRDGKTRLSSDIVQMIRSCGGRFLKCNDSTGEWEDQDDIVAREKVAHALRSCKADAGLSNKAIKKTRVFKKHEPTERENILFAHAVQYQRQVFQQLMSLPNGSDEDSNSDDSSSNGRSSPKSSGTSSSQSSQSPSSEDYCDELDTTPVQAFEILEVDYEIDTTLDYLDEPECVFPGYKQTNCTL